MSSVERIANALRGVSMCALIAMMLVTVVDITMRLAINQLVLGSVEIVQLSIVAVVFFALPETCLRGQHITVDVIDQFLAARTQRRFRFLGSVLTLLLLAVMAWRMVPFAFDTLVIGDLSTDLQLSLFWYWLPILVGSVSSVLTMLYVVIREYREIDTPASSTPSELHAE